MFRPDISVPSSTGDILILLVPLLTGLEADKNIFACGICF